jgi:CspA family cold shock protein
MPTGKVKWFNSQKGFGFITPDESGYVLLVHTKDIEGGSLRENEKVTYKVGQGDNGIYAKGVSLITNPYRYSEGSQNFL